MIFLSFKTYKEATGEKAVYLCQIVKKVINEFNIPIIPILQPTDIYRVKKEVGIEIWAQHADPIDPGRHFGWLSPYSLKEAGASGVVINHAERPLDEETIKKIITKAKIYQLKTLVLCQTVDLAKKVELWEPDYIGYEKEELIAGSLSMVDVEEENIKKLANNLNKSLIIGAAISTKEHVRKTLLFGGKGVILASAFVLAKNPEEKLKELVLAFIKK